MKQQATFTGNPYRPNLCDVCEAFAPHVFQLPLGTWHEMCDTHAAETRLEAVAS